MSEMAIGHQGKGHALANAPDWYSSDEPENLVEMAPSCIGTDAFDCYFGDVAHNPTQEEFLVAWYSDEIGETVQHVYGQRLDAELVPVTLSHFTID